MLPAAACSTHTVNHTVPRTVAPLAGAVMKTGKVPPPPPELIVKVRLFDASNNTTTEATTQVFFDDTITDTVYKNVSPYSGRSTRDTRNSADNIYGNQTVLLLSLSGDTASGFTGTIPLGVRVGQVNAG